MPEYQGTRGRTHGQAYRMHQEKSAPDATGGDNKVESGEVKGKNVVAIKHNDGPPYKVKHEDGSTTDHATKEELMTHLEEHLPGGEDEDNAGEESMDSDYGSEGSAEALKSLLG